VIRKRNGRFAVVVYDPRVKKKVWVGTYDSEEEAERHEELAKACPHIPGYGVDTCESFARRWTTDFPRPAKATKSTYDYALKRFIEKFGPLRLIELDRPTCYQWALAQPYGTSTTCRTMLNDAINAGLYRGPNPFADLRRPKSKGRRDIDVLSLPDLDELVACAARCWGDYGTNVFGPLLIFQAFVTTRPAELYFIERTDVRGDEVYVIDSDDSRGNPKDPKNGNKRKVVLPPPAAEAIVRVPARIDVPWLFYTKTGKQLNKSNLSYYWRPVQKMFGRDDLDFYDLRHFGGSYMTNDLELPPEVTAIQMGHRDRGHMVRTLYGHKSETLAREELRHAYRERYRPPETPRQAPGTSR
jgi:integrase